ncbi:MAG: transposase [Candidatus Thermoplasmatota archaeon]
MTDTTGYSTLRYSAWLNVRTLQKSKKKCFIKHHFIGCYWNKGILAQKVTPSYRHESPVFRQNMKKIPPNIFTEVSGDKAFLSRINCRVCEVKGIKPYFKIRENVRSLAKGNPAWKNMIYEYRNMPEQYNFCYHRRSIAESIISSEKRRLGHVLFSKKRKTQKIEKRLRTVVYNLLVIVKLRASEILNEPLLLPN